MVTLNKHCVYCEHSTLVLCILLTFSYMQLYLCSLFLLLNADILVFDEYTRFVAEF